MSGEMKEKQSSRQKKSDKIDQQLETILSGTAETGRNVMNFINSRMHSLLLGKYMESGRNYLAKADYLQALSAFGRAVSIEPKNGKAYLGMAKACQGMNDYDAAMQILEQGYRETGDKRILKAYDYAIIWEDEAFETIIRDYLGKEEGEIYWSEVRDIKELTVNGVYVVRKDEKDGSCGVISQSRNRMVYFFRTDKRNIKEADARGEIITLNDIRHFTSLEKLTVFYNSLKDISALKTLTKLQYLFLGYNHIENIGALNSLTKLTALYLYDNKIRNIRALKKLTNLTVLELYDNQIEDVSALGGLTELTGLYLHNNQIEDVSALGSLTKLNTLFLYQNNIMDVSALGALKNLQNLYLWDNFIMDHSPVSFVDNLLRDWD